MSAQTQQAKADLEHDFTNETQPSTQIAMREESNVYRPKIEEDTIKVSESAPERVQQNFIRRQQYYTGDA